MDSGQRFTSLIYASFLFFLHSHGVLSYYVPSDDPQDFQKGDELMVLVNELTSIKTQLPYLYYSLPYCRPENHGEDLRGDRIDSSPYVFKFRESQMCNVVCKLTLDAKLAKSFKEKIDNEYRVNMILDQLPLVVRTDKQAPPVYQLGFHVGVKGQLGPGVKQEEKYYLHNHLAYTVRYHKDALTNASRIVGFEVKPYSVKHEYEGEWKNESTHLSTCDPHSRHTITSPNNKVEVAENQEVIFTYDIDFQESDVEWDFRWDAYLLRSDHQIHWPPVMNGLIIILSVFHIVLTVMLYALYRDIESYDELEALELGTPEEKGWKLIHGDVFRPPANSDLLCVYAGTGVQCFMMISLILIFGALSVLAPPYDGEKLAIFVLLFWALFGFVAGLVSVKLYKLFNGTDWKKIALKTAFIFPGSVAAIIFFLNILMRSQNSSGAIPCGKMFVLICSCFCISVPLVFYGTHVGFTDEDIGNLVQPNQVPRKIPDQTSWYLNPIFLILIGGILPFASVYFELRFILTAIWHHQFYHMFGFLIIVFNMLIITCAKVAVLLCYLQLHNEDYLWWWRSYLTSGSSALYLFLYATFYFFTELDITSLVSGMLYFGYMLIASYAFFALTGTIGFITCFYFVARIYSTLDNH